MSRAKPCFFTKMHSFLSQKFDLFHFICEIARLWDGNNVKNTDFYIILNKFT